MKCVFDIEADGLYQEATKIHCSVFKDVVTGRVYRFTDTRSMIAFMQKCKLLIGHNIIDYDIPLIERLTGYKFKGRKLDTLLLSRELRKNAFIPPQMKKDYKEAGKKLEGPHSLATWGYRVGRGKPSVDDWENLPIETYLHRCEEDVEINYLVYLELKEELDKGYFPPAAVGLTMDFMECISRQQRHGWKLDVDRCKRYVKQLTRWIENIDKALYPYLPHVPTVKEDRTDEDGYSDGFQNPFTKTGDINARLQKWIDNNDLVGFDTAIRGPFCRVDFRKVNLASDKEIKEFLLGLGWQPEEWNYSKVNKDEEGKPLRTGPKLSPNDAFIGVNGKMGRLICKRVQCVHRRSNIQGWIDRVREDGRLESRISGFADTYRVRHANIANVPNTESFFGKQMRSCFIAEEGMVLVSTDAASCQDRMLISRARDAGIKDPVFEDMILNGDKSKGTDSHTRAKEELNKVFRKEGLPEITRGSAKNFNYAYKFNAGDKKLGTMAGILEDNRAKELGKKLRAGLDTVFQAQVKLEQVLKREWERNAKRRKVRTRWGKEKVELFDGKVKGLDGRSVLIRNEKDILVFMLQSDEALMMAYATVLLNFRLGAKYKEGVEWKQVCFYHDEVTIECLPEIAEDVKIISEQAIYDSGRHFKLSIDQIGEGAIGGSWREIH